MAREIAVKQYNVQGVGVGVGGGHGGSGWGWGGGLGGGEVSQCKDAILPVEEFPL